MIIVRTYHADRTFGMRLNARPGDTGRSDEAPIKIHIGTMIDGYLDGRIAVELTTSNALNIIAVLQRLVEAADEAGLSATAPQGHPAIEFGSISYDEGPQATPEEKRALTEMLFNGDCGNGIHQVVRETGKCRVCGAMINEPEQFEDTPRSDPMPKAEDL